MMSLIRRSIDIPDIQFRKTVNDETGAETLSFRGHAAVFNQPTLIGSTRYGFVEWLQRGSFKSALNDDVRFLVNHDGLPLARTTNGSLALSEDATGLVAEANLAPISLSHDLAALIERGDVTQMSFAFYPGAERVGTINLKERAKDDLPAGIPDEWDGMPFRAITKVARLFDVSPVTYPAYEGTNASMVSAKTEAEVRSFMDSLQEEDPGYTAKYSSVQRASRLRAIHLALHEA